MISRAAPLLLLFACIVVSTARAEEAFVPVLVPVTGFVALEGTSQRNGAVLALDNPPPGVAVRYEVTDTGVAPETAVTALERALSRTLPTAVVAPILGTQMLAMLPLAAETRVPLVTVSGTARITELGNPYVFRFFPGDAVVKEAHARFVVEELKRRRPAILYQTTAYGQSGRQHLVETFRRLGVEPVFEEGLDTGVKDLVPVIGKALAAGPDVLVLHLHAPTTALFIKQAAALGNRLPIVAGSAMHQPATAELLEPAELASVCAETASSPISGETPRMRDFRDAYRRAFGREPDAFALAQYDGVMMVLAAVAHGARAGEAVRRALAEGSHDGIAMRYRSDGRGNMAHDAVIVCFDGVTRVPRVVKRYESPPTGTP